MKLIVGVFVVQLSFFDLQQRLASTLIHGC